METWPVHGGAVALSFDPSRCSECDVWCLGVGLWEETGGVFASFSGVDSDGLEPLPPAEQLLLGSWNRVQQHKN